MTWFFAIKKFINPTTIFLTCFAALSVKCWYLDSALESERAECRVFKTEQETLVKFQEVQNRNALDFSNFMLTQQQVESDTKLANVLSNLNKTVNLNEELNDALTLSRANVERLRDFVRSDYSDRDSPEAVGHPEGRPERDRTHTEDIRTLVSACAKTTIDFNKCKAREQLVCGGKFPVKCTGEMP